MRLPRVINNDLMKLHYDLMTPVDLFNGSMISDGARERERRIFVRCSQRRMYNKRNIESL